VRAVSALEQRVAYRHVVNARTGLILS